MRRNLTTRRSAFQKTTFLITDSPYNTGNAFEHYDDGIEHSIWLGLMRDRLEVLHRLLTPDGFLCCQIDDQEGAYLKVLLDEVFGRQNYLTTFYIQVRYGSKTLAEDSDFQKVIEQCFIYAKDAHIGAAIKSVEEYKVEKF
jgi:adenine-specific DNA-methyltransferase